jgi:hypothetical protein
MGIANDAEGQARIAAFRQGLRELGWTEGRNVRFDHRLAILISKQRMRSNSVAAKRSTIAGRSPIAGIGDYAVPAGTTVIIS